MLVQAAGLGGLWGLALTGAWQLGSGLDGAAGARPWPVLLVAAMLAPAAAVPSAPVWTLAWVLAGGGMALYDRRFHRLLTSLLTVAWLAGSGVAGWPPGVAAGALLFPLWAAAAPRLGGPWSAAGAWAGGGLLLTLAGGPAVAAALPAQLAAAPLAAAPAVLWVCRRRRLDQALDDQRFRVEHDALTGALSRTGLERWLAAHNRVPGMVVAIDLDDFKWINDTYGHQAGDAVLREVVERLQPVLRAGDAVVRMGGDEFTVWLPGPGPADGADLAERLHTVLTVSPFVLPPLPPLMLGASMGWVAGPLSWNLAEAADAALLRAKRAGKNRVAGEGPGTAPAAAVPVSLRWLVDACEALWEHWDTAAVLADRQGRIVAANPAYQALTGYHLDELRGRSPAMLSAGNTDAGVYDALWGALTARRPWHGCLQNRRKDGSLWWEALSIYPVVMAGHTVGFWAVVREVPAPAASEAAAAVPVPPGTGRAQPVDDDGGRV